MFAVEPAAGGGGEEELAAVGVWSGVGHGEQTWYLQSTREVIA